MNGAIDKAGLEEAVAAYVAEPSHYMYDMMAAAITAYLAHLSAEPVAMMIASYDAEGDCVSWLEGCERLERGDYLYAAPPQQGFEEGVEAAAKELIRLRHLLNSQFEAVDIMREDSTYAICIEAIRVLGGRDRG